MCLAIYLASQHPLPTFNHHERYPELLISPHLYKKKAAVEETLNLPFIYYVGSWEGCSCGFNPPSREAGEDESGRTEREMSAASRSSLSRYLADQIGAGELALYVAWDGEEGSPIQLKRTISPDYFLTDPFEPLETNTLLRIQAVP